MVGWWPVSWSLRSVTWGLQAAKPSLSLYFSTHQSQRSTQHRHPWQALVWREAGRISTSGVATRASGTAWVLTTSSKCPDIWTLSLKLTDCARIMIVIGFGVGRAFVGSVVGVKRWEAGSGRLVTAGMSGFGWTRIGSAAVGLLLLLLAGWWIGWRGTLVVGSLLGCCGCGCIEEMGAGFLRKIVLLSWTWRPRLAYTFWGFRRLTCFVGPLWFQRNRFGRTWTSSAAEGQHEAS